MWPFDKKPKKSLKTMTQDEFDELDDDYFEFKPPSRTKKFLRKIRNLFKGDVGEPGMQGPMGCMGKPGLSEYELAQSVGFEGTLLEWLDPDIKRAFLVEKMSVEAGGTITAVENK